MKKILDKNLTNIAWFQAFIATAGSLYFSEVLHFKPCVLCWYQRILMYPLVLIIGTGVIRKDKNLPYYALPLSAMGLAIALYHNLLQWRIIPEAIAPCQIGVPCVTRYAGWFGFITIPLLSLTAFWIITFLMIRQLKINRK